MQPQRRTTTADPELLCFSNMPVSAALNFADEWSKGTTFYPGQEGWRVVCATLAAEVRRMERRENELNNLFELQQRRMEDAAKAWQAGTGKTDVLPDLGELLTWLMVKADIIKA